MRRGMETTSNLFTLGDRCHRNIPKTMTIGVKPKGEAEIGVQERDARALFSN